MLYLLGRDYYWVLERRAKQTRLLVCRSARTWVCRLTSYCDHREFLVAPDADIFPGLLRLHKKNPQVLIPDKEIKIGFIASADLAIDLTKLEKE
jgi:hypothetical protein